VNITDKQIQDFIDAWRKDFGETLSLAAAENEAKSLLNFFVQMAEGLARQRATKEAPVQPAVSSFNDHGNLKAVWRKTMRKRHV